MNQDEQNRLVGYLDHAASFSFRTQSGRSKRLTPSVRINGSMVYLSVVQQGWGGVLEQKNGCKSKTLVLSDKDALLNFVDWYAELTLVNRKQCYLFIYWLDERLKWGETRLPNEFIELTEDIANQVNEANDEKLRCGEFASLPPTSLRTYSTDPPPGVVEALLL